MVGSGGEVDAKAVAPSHTAGDSKTLPTVHKGLGVVAERVGPRSEQPSRQTPSVVESTQDHSKMETEVD